MDIFNMSSFHPEYFILIGIPGLEDFHLLISVPFCVMYMMALIGNSLLLFIIATNHCLHQPMYIFLTMLAITDLLLCSSAVPKTLSIFWFESHEIWFYGCLLQVFSIHYLFVIESSILLTMAYDRYIAICFPLTYTNILTNSFIIRILFLCMVRALFIITPLILLLNRLPYRHSNVIAHSFCEHMAVANLATADNLVNSIYGLVAAFSSTGIDMVIIVMSYVVIFRTVLRLPYSEARLKAFNTCVSHICVITMFYIPAFFSFVAHRAAKGKIPPSVHIMLANLYVLVPPMMNPIIYGVRTKEIRHRVFGMFCRRNREVSFWIQKMTSSTNSTHFPPWFLLAGLPGLEDAYDLISIPFCLMFFTSIVGNGLVLIVIMQNYQLQQPMYLFLSMLAIVDLLFSLFTSPSVLSIFLFNSRKIQSHICLLQMFFIHSLSVIESSLLLAMALDRFVAICNPLRYASIFTNSIVAKIGLASTIRGTVIHLPPVGSLKFLPYCKGNVLSHSYCLHQDVMKLACDGANIFNILYGLAVILCTVTLDVILIFLSYLVIIKTVLGIASEMERHKAFNTCVSHLCAVVIFYVPMVALSIIHRFGVDTSPFFKIVMANVYLFVPPMLNPIIYSIKSKQIRDGFYRAFGKRRVISGNG
ncbi:uncharacterized protein WCC33_001412 [Rhinophrynus dorsalis]